MGQATNSWDVYFIKLAQFISTKSKDPSTRVGAVIVGHDNEIRSTGFNGFPRGIDEVNHPHRWERPEKYSWVIHAEANAVLNAARVGTPLKNTTCYMNYMPIPCSICTGILIQAGVTKIVGPNIKFTGKGTGVHYDVDKISSALISEAVIQTEVIELTEEDNRIYTLLGEL